MSCPNCGYSPMEFKPSVGYFCVDCGWNEEELTQNTSFLDTQILEVQGLKPTSQKNKQIQENFFEDYETELAEVPDEFAKMYEDGIFG